MRYTYWQRYIYLTTAWDSLLHGQKDTLSHVVNPKSARKFNLFTELEEKNRNIFMYNHLST